MKYSQYTYVFEIRQRVTITKSGDEDNGLEAIVRGYSYYPEGVLYELDIPNGYSGFLFWKKPLYRHRGLQPEFLVVA